MPDDDATSDDAPLGPPLPPEDRLWRHPSELSSMAPPAAAPPVAPRSSPASDGATGRSGHRLWSVALTSGLTGAVLALGVVALVSGLGGGVTERVVERVPVSDDRDALRSSGGGVPQVAADVSPSVVRLEVTTAQGEVTGSGVVARDDGIILTNAHLVAGAESIAVVVAGGRVVRGRVVGLDTLTDVAVVDATGDDWVPAVLGSSTALEVGEAAIAIGSPLGLRGDPSVTAGVVSGLGRRVAVDGSVLHGLIQTDAPIAEGSSGGALCDARGVVVGITTAVASDDGMGFAIPVEVAKAVADELLAAGSVRRAWLGIAGADDATSGVRVVGVEPDGPAAAAGIVVGDVVVALDREPLATMSDLLLALRDHDPGDVVAVDLGSGRRVDVELGERP